MKAIVVTDQAAGTAGMKLVERPDPQAAINDVIVQVYASGFVGVALAPPIVGGPSTSARRSLSNQARGPLPDVAADSPVVP